MNKEIDEIIEQIKTAIRFKKMSIPSDYHISIYDMEKLLNYITNSQEKIDKAIEYIEALDKNEFETIDDVIVLDNYLNDLLDILRGSDINED